ncbi:MAG: chorismate lyase [Methylophilaceae bacterium]
MHGDAGRNQQSICVCDNAFVKNQHQYFNQRSKWLNKPILSGNFGTWLIEASSLTARLQQRYVNFSVQTVRLQDERPLQDEAALLRSPSYQFALVREVLLKGEGQAVVFAHSVLPKNSLRGAWNGLGKLGNKPLGATLFANAKVKRRSLSYKKLSSNHALYQHAVRHIAHKPGYLWARRSIFSLNCASILVTEVFLPALLNKY